MRHAFLVIFLVGFIKGCALIRFHIINQARLRRLHLKHGILDGRLHLFAHRGISKFVFSQPSGKEDRANDTANQSKVGRAFQFQRHFLAVIRGRAFLLEHDGIEDEKDR